MTEGEDDKMFYVEKEKCIGCGMCVRDCIVRDIEFVDGKAEMKNRACFTCGHCIAICPTGAVWTDTYSMADVEKYDPDTFDIVPDNLLNFIKFRRSVRSYQEREVEDEKIGMIIEAGRFTPTATNSQDVSYVVVKKDIMYLKEHAMEALKKLAEHIQENSKDKRALMYSNMMLGMHKRFEIDKKDDGLFYNAPAILITLAKNPENAELASSNMELMTNALGLGAVYCGFFTVAAEQSPEIREFLQVSEDEKIVSCLLIGYPAVKYRRTVPRKAPKISWK